MPHAGVARPQGTCCRAPREDADGNKVPALTDLHVLCRVVTATSDQRKRWRRLLSRHGCWAVEEVGDGNADKHGHYHRTTFRVSTGVDNAVGLDAVCEAGMVEHVEYVLSTRVPWQGGGGGEEKPRKEPRRSMEVRKSTRMPDGKVHWAAKGRGCIAPTTVVACEKRKLRTLQRERTLPEEVKPGYENDLYPVAEVRRPHEYANMAAAREDSYHTNCPK